MHRMKQLFYLVPAVLLAAVFGFSSLTLAAPTDRLMVSEPFSTPEKPSQELKSKSW